ncbi:TIGR03621 family F420-dependent LLM class oxidoreductase [Nocardia panacis]|uniref:TIGR03621 family F420-dependent LLM class oxidoreductase n=1 Tax=Nocardia panacis TaxID=2340916 RepID=A0A3A4KXA2_9NOCA|nr:TIGR03621 family F420-dependent LLM class oxidoreductase [Nocardia panacis]RJO78339.1 TIGR03621 family F420-dependent LLM class oxidoreductase [Nocardia panacis]
MGSLRFGVGLLALESRARWVEKCRRAEDSGFDVIGVPDHLGRPSPFPALVLAAEATSRVRLSTFVLNTPFYNPVLLARDVAGTDRCVDGRLELGLGAGYVRAEFEAAGIPFATGRQRIEYLARTAATLRELFTRADFPPAQPGGPPMLIAGWGDRLLRVAARYADIIALPGAAAARDGAKLRMATATATEARIAYIRELVGSRPIELNSMLQRVVGPSQRSGLLDRYAHFLDPKLPAAPEDMPTLLVGTPRQRAEQLRERAERFGFTYFSVLEHDMTAMAEVIEHLR